MVETVSAETLREDAEYFTGPAQKAVWLAALDVGWVLERLTQWTVPEDHRRTYGDTWCAVQLTHPHGSVGWVLPNGTFTREAKCRPPWHVPRPRQARSRTENGARRGIGSY